MRNVSQVYRFARKFMLKQIPDDNAESILVSYLDRPDASRKVVSINELYKKLLSSAQNANMKRNVIAKAMRGGFDDLGKGLFCFDPRKVLRNFDGDPAALLAHIVKTVKPTGQIRKGSRSIWPKYCVTILSAARFLRQFEDERDFYRWANSMYRDRRSKAGLPMVIAAEIEGVGYALACDFLKELGFRDYGKPDVHIKQIFAALDWCPKGASDYEVQKTIVQVADDLKVTPYHVDKLFWLIGSGNLSEHKHLGRKGRIGSTKKEFIKETRKLLAA